MRFAMAADLLLRCGDWVDTHGFLLFFVLLLIYLCAALGYSLATPLWHDEFFTFHIAQAPSFQALIHQIRTLDLNPPLSYLLTRASFRLFGVGTLQCRLPEIAGFVLAMVGVFLFAKRRLGNAFGLLAVALLISSEPAFLSFQARPYGLMLGFTALSLAMWQIAAEPALGSRRARWANPLLFLALLALLLTHVFSLLVWASIVAGELAQVYLRRRIDWPRALAVVLPIGAVALYLPLLRNHDTSAFPPAFQPTLVTVQGFYQGQLALPLLCLLCAALLVALVSRGAWLRGAGCGFLSAPEAVAVGGIVAAPIVLITYLWRTHAAFFDRYCFTADLGLALLLAVLLCWWTSRRPAVALLAMLLLLPLSHRLPDAVGSLKHLAIFRHAEPYIPPDNLASLMLPGLPMVDASGLTFVEMNERTSPAFLSRVYFLDDPAAALQYAHATIFNGMQAEVKAFGFRGHVESYAPFLAQHPRFYVFGTYDYPEDWLLRKLQADGYHLSRLGPVHAYYKDQELYEVTAPSAASMSPSCTPSQTR